MGDNVINRRYAIRWLTDGTIDRTIDGSVRTRDIVNLRALIARIKDSQGVMPEVLEVTMTSTSEYAVTMGERGQGAYVELGGFGEPIRTVLGFMWDRSRVLFDASGGLRAYGPVRDYLSVVGKPERPLTWEGELPKIGETKVGLVVLHDDLRLEASCRKLNEFDLDAHRE